MTYTPPTAPERQPTATWARRGSISFIFSRICATPVPVPDRGDDPHWDRRELARLRRGDDRRHLDRPHRPGALLVDDGAGVRRRELARYHDLAPPASRRAATASTPASIRSATDLPARRSVTETRRGRHHVASSWRLALARAPPAGGARGPRGGARDSVAGVPERARLWSIRLRRGVLRRAFQPLFDRRSGSLFCPSDIPAASPSS